MCGRKTLSKDVASIIKEMDIEQWEAHDYKPNYNIAPTDSSLVLIKDMIRKTKMMRWGLIPSWVKNDSFSSKMINARAETVLEKPSFYDLVHKNRCVVLCDGYFEWARQDSQPYYIRHPKNNILPLAGLWTKCNDSNSNTLFTYTVLTTAPCKNISHIHNRMPVILNKKNTEQWINCKKFSASDCLIGFPNVKTDLVFYPVSTNVNSTKNNSAENIN